MWTLVPCLLMFETSILGSLKNKQKNSIIISPVELFKQNMV